MADQAIVRYLVISFGGLHSTGDPRPVWHVREGHADQDIKRRLGVRRLHRKARRSGSDVVAGEHTRIYEGEAWSTLWAEDFKAVPASHPDFARAGGFTLYTMYRMLPTTESSK